MSHFRGGAWVTQMKEVLGWEKVGAIDLVKMIFFYTNKMGGARNKRIGRKKKDGEKGRESEGEKLGHKENEVIIMSMA